MYEIRTLPYTKAHIRTILKLNSIIQPSINFELVLLVLVDLLDLNRSNNAINTYGIQLKALEFMLSGDPFPEFSMAVL